MSIFFFHCRGNDEIIGEVGLWVVDGGVEGVVWGWDVWGNVDELGEAEVITEIFYFPSEVNLDCMESHKCLSRCEVTNSNCKSSRNTGSGTKLDNSDSEKFTNKDVSNCSSKGSSSR